MKQLLVGTKAIPTDDYVLHQPFARACLRGWSHARRRPLMDTLAAIPSQRGEEAQDRPPGRGGRIDA